MRNTKNWHQKLNRIITSSAQISFFGTVINERNSGGLTMEERDRNEMFVEYLIQWDGDHGYDWVFSRRLVPLWPGMSKSARK